MNNEKGPLEKYGYFSVWVVIIGVLLALTLMPISNWDVLFSDKVVIVIATAISAIATASLAFFNWKIIRQHRDEHELYIAHT